MGMFDDLLDTKPQKSSGLFDDLLQGDTARQELAAGVSPSTAGAGRGAGSLQLAAEVPRQSWRNDTQQANLPAPRGEYSKSGSAGFLATGRGLIDRAMQSIFGSQAESEAKKADFEKLQRELEKFGNKTSAVMKSNARARADFVKKNGRFPKEENEDGSRKGSPQDWE